MTEALVAVEYDTAGSEQVEAASGLLAWLDNPQTKLVIPDAIRPLVTDRLDSLYDQAELAADATLEETFSRTAWYAGYLPSNARQDAHFCLAGYDAAALEIASPEYQRSLNMLRQLIKTGPYQAVRYVADRPPVDLVIWQRSAASEQAGQSTEIPPIIPVFTAPAYPISTSGDWRDQANCRDVDPDIFFPKPSGSTAEAKQICKTCPVRLDCLDYAQITPEKEGVWGGLSRNERLKLRNRQREQSDETV